jgi:hypothetical protein
LAFFFVAQRVSVLTGAIFAEVSLVRLLPQKLPPELGTLLADENTDKEHDPYADIIGTC